MNVETSPLPLPDFTPPQPANSPRKAVAGVYLAISLTIHLIAIAAVLLTSTQRNPGPTVTYIDINSVADTAQPASPAIHARAREAEQIKTEAPAEPVPLPEKPAEAASTETPPAPAPPTVQEAQATSLERGMASGYFSSFAEGKNLRDEIREYYFVLLQQINHRWWLRAKTLRETAKQDGIVMFVIGRDGTLMEAQLSKGTGSREVDRAIIEVLKEAAPFPPLPASYPLAGFRAPIRIAAPSHLFSIRSLR